MCRDAGVVSQSEVGESELYALSAVRVERVVTDHVRRIVVRVVGRRERAADAAAASRRLVIAAVHRPTAVSCYNTAQCVNIQMMHGSEWTLKYDEPEVENVARGRVA